MRYIIYGKGEHGRVVHNVLKLQRGVSASFVDDVKPTQLDVTDLKPDDFIYMGVGDVELRDKLYTESGIGFSTLVAPTALISTDLLGQGSFFGQRCVVGVGASVGKACIINTGAIVEHDCSIGDFTEVSIGALIGGSTVVDGNCFIGMGAVLTDHITVGAGCFIQAGAIVTKNVPAYSVVRSHRREIQEK